MQPALPARLGGEDQLSFWNITEKVFLASQDALEVMRVTYSLTHSLSHLLSVSIDFTDVTLVSDDTRRRLY